ncbi:MAG TPA: porin family protein [Campylobacterales bacterium]|nr:porin family protein [Campylobacterales bacterium]
MKLKNSIIAIAALSSMSFAGGDIGGVTTFENNDMVNAEVEAVEPEISSLPEVEATPTPEATPAPVVTKASVKETPQVEKTSSGPSGLYVGLAVSDMVVRSDDEAYKAFFSEKAHSDKQVGITALIGYNFMKYLGAELRAALSVSGENAGQDNLAEYGIYLKPQYPVLDNLNVYGLLGYSAINMSDPATSTSANDNPFDGDNQGFSFGAGLDYGVTENISVFTDVVNYLRDYGGSNSTWGANLGVKYNF